MPHLRPMRWAGNCSYRKLPQCQLDLCLAQPVKNVGRRLVAMINDNSQIGITSRVMALWRADPTALFHKPLDLMFLILKYSGPWFSKGQVRLFNLEKSNHNNFLLN